MAKQVFFSEGKLMTADGDVIGFGINAPSGAGTLAQIQIGTTKLRSGAGAPTAIASDAVGDIYFRTDGAVAGTCIYRCSVAGTTWVATSA